MPNPVVRLSKELKDVQTSPEPDITLEPFDSSKHCLQTLKQTTAPLSLHESNNHNHNNNNHNNNHYPQGNDLFTWIACIAGPPETAYEGGRFHVLLQVPRDYPMSPPQARFLTRVFHPNVNFHTGEICLDILKGKWSPAWTLSSVCRAVSSLLAAPAADSPLNCDAGNLVRAGDLVGFRSMVRLYAIMDAGAPPFP